MEPVSVVDVALFLQKILDVFGGHLVMVFSMMIAFSLLYGIRKLLLGAKT